MGVWRAAVTVRYSVLVYCQPFGNEHLSPRPSLSVCVSIQRPRGVNLGTTCNEAPERETLVDEKFDGGEDGPSRAVSAVLNFPARPQLYMHHGAREVRVYLFTSQPTDQ